MVTLKSVRFRAEFQPIMGYTLGAHSSVASPSTTSSSSSNSSHNRTKSNSARCSPASPSHRHSSSIHTASMTSTVEKVGHGPPIASTVILVQEKGALSTFRHVHSALRREWKGSNGGGTQSLREPDMNAHAVPVVGTPKLK